MSARGWRLPEGRSVERLLHPLARPKPDRQPSAKSRYSWSHSARRAAACGSVRQVQQKGGHGLAGLCGLAEVGLFVLLKVVHVEVAVGFEPVLVGLDG